MGMSIIRSALSKQLHNCDLLRQKTPKHPPFGMECHANAKSSVSSLAPNAIKFSPSFHNLSPQITKSRFQFRLFPSPAQVFYYSTSLFMSSGLTEESAKFATIGIGAIMVSDLFGNKNGFQQQHTWQTTTTKL